MGADKKDVDATQSAEAVAYRLLVDILEAEGRSLTNPTATTARLSRAVLLDAYSECLQAVRGQRERRGVQKAAE